MAARASAVRRQRELRPERAARSGPIGVVDRRRALSTAHRREARLLFLLAAVIVAGALTIGAVGHAMLASSQLSSDQTRSELSQALDTQQNLKYERALLETPARVLSIAEQRLKMVAPSGVSYLKPVTTGETVEEAHAEKAAGSEKKPGASKGHSSH